VQHVGEVGFEAVSGVYFCPVCLCVNSCYSWCSCLKVEPVKWVICDVNYVCLHFVVYAFLVWDVF